MTREFYITLCIALQCSIMGMQWYKNDVLSQSQQHNAQLHKTQRYLLRQKEELEQEIASTYDAIKQFATNELKMAPIKDKQIRILPC